MPPARPLSEAEVRRRRPVWVALSDLWLDTETTEADLRHIARVAAASGYSDEEIEHIHWHEVAPVVAGNFLTVAGVWTGFDEEWLCEQAASLAAKPAPRLSPMRLLARRLLSADWQRFLAALPLARLEVQPADEPGG